MIDAEICQAWIIVIFFMHSLGQRREVIYCLSDETVYWTDDNKKVYIKPINEKTIRSTNMGCIWLDNLLTIMLGFQMAVIRIILRGDKTHNAVWINPISGKRLSADSITLLVKRTIRSIIPNSNVTPQDFRRLWSSAIVGKGLTLKDKSNEETVQIWAEVVNTSVNMARQFYNRAHEGDKYKNILTQFCDQSVEHNQWLKNLVDKYKKLEITFQITDNHSDLTIPPPPPAPSKGRGIKHKSTPKKKKFDKIDNDELDNNEKIQSNINEKSDNVTPLNNNDKTETINNEMESINNENTNELKSTNTIESEINISNIQSQPIIKPKRYAKRRNHKLKGNYLIF